MDFAMVSFTDGALIIGFKAAVLCVYVAAVVLDFYSQQRQFKLLFLSSKVASTYALKNKLALFSRGFSFLIAPALGFLAFRIAPKDMVELFLICAVSGMCFVLISYAIFCKQFPLSKESKSSVKSKTFFPERFIGYIAFGVAINAPFILNIGATMYKESALWLVQLAPIVTAFSTAYIIFFYETRLASLIDGKDINHTNARSFLIERVLGRALAVFFVLVFYVFLI